MTKAAKKAKSIIDKAIEDAPTPLSDRDYLEVLEYISWDVEGRVDAKTQEMSDDGE